MGSRHEFSQDALSLIDASKKLNYSTKLWHDLRKREDGTEMSEHENDSAGENKTRDVVEAVTTLVQTVPIYQDIAQPAAKEIGKALGTVAKTVNVALAPVAALVWGYDQFAAFISGKVTERLSTIPPEDIVTPKPNVAGPAMEALRYTGHEESLSDMYANLLASAMDRSTAEEAHPAFVEIIKQLTPTEAKILNLFISQRAHPIINLRAEIIETNDGNDRVINYSHLWKKCGLPSPKSTPAYLDNFCRLGLMHIPDGYSITAEGFYDELESDPIILKIKGNINTEPGKRAEIIRRYVTTTQLGNQFIEACIKQKSRTDQSE